MDDLVKTARRAKGSDLLPKVSFGTMNAETLILRMADRIEELEAEFSTVKKSLTVAQAKLAKAVEALEYADRMVRVDLSHMTEWGEDFSQAVVDTGERITAALEEQEKDDE